MVLPMNELVLKRKGRTTMKAWIGVAAIAVVGALCAAQTVTTNCAKKQLDAYRAGKRK